jgi:hypothetical protein
MNMVVVRNRAEVYEMVRQAQQTSLQEHPPRVSVRAPDLDEEMRSNLQAEIQAAVDRTLERAKPVLARPDREPTDEELRQMISAQIRELRSAPPEEPRQRPSGPTGVRVTMSNLPLSDKDRRTLQSEVQQLVRKRLDGVTLRKQLITVCGCTWPYWFQPCCMSPSPADLKQLGPLPDPTDPSTPPFVVALYFNSGHDVLRMTLWAWDRHDPSPLPMDQIVVGLRIDPTFEPNMLPKEIQGWAYCDCAVGPIIHQDNSQAWYKWLPLDEETSGVATIVFREMTSSGMTDIGSFDPSQFWSILGGWTITFDWLADSGFQGS